MKRGNAFLVLVVKLFSLLSVSFYLGGQRVASSGNYYY